AAFLGKKDNALAGLIDRPARTVRRDKNVSVRGERIDELAQRDHTFPRARAANRAVARAFDENRDQVAVAACADESIALARRKTGIENPREHEQSVMPDREDDRSFADES